YLKEVSPQLRIGILEAGFLPSGASTKNAGFACFGSVSEAMETIKQSSEESFLKVVEMRWKGLQKLRQNLGDQAIDFQSLGGYEIFKQEEKESAGECIEAIPYLHSILKEIIGTSDIYAVKPAKIADFGFEGIETIIENSVEGQIDTGKMMLA